MIISRAEHPSWLSNAYLVADGDGGHGVLVDSNGVEEPLLEEVERRGITITHVLVTHSHPDHVVRVGELGRRFGVPVLAHELASAVDGVTGTTRRRRHRAVGRPRDPRAGDAGPLPRPSRAAGERAPTA